MKKLVLALAATAALSSVAFAQSNVSNTQLIITGEITEASCNMVIKPIQFPSISVKQFQTTNAKSGWEVTNVEFTQCVLDDSANGGPKVDKIELIVDSGVAAGSSNYYANSGTAEGMAVELEVNGNVIDASAGKTLNLDLTTANKNVPVRARLASVGAVTAGDINAAIGFTAVYK